METEQMRLQKEVDTFTQKLEHEKRRLLIIEEQIKQVNEELAERDRSVKQLKPSQLVEKKSNIKMTSTSKNVNNERVKLNQTKARNQKLRSEVDVLRKEMTSATIELDSLKKGIKKNKREAENQNKEYILGKKVAEEANNQIIALRAKHEEEKERFENEIKKLTDRLKVKDEMIEFDDKNFDQSYQQAKDKSKASDFSNPVAILKLRLNKIIATNKEKKKLMDQYIRNVKVIEDAFEQIKEASGISNIEEIVTTFVKAEEQNHSLYNYVNMLNTETDVLEESNKDIKEQIQRILERGQMSEKEKQDLQKALEAECRHLESEIDRNLHEADETKTIFKKVQPHVEKMIREFSKTKFFLSVAPKQYYETGFTFNESNIVQYLAELEEYIAILITYLATKRDDPSAPFALIPLDKLDTKNHNKKEIAVSIGN